MRSEKSGNPQGPQPRILVKRFALSMLFAVTTISLSCLPPLLSPPHANAASAKKWLPAEPTEATVGQVYFNTTDKREYIYNGEEWVPHDASIDTYVLKKHRKSKVSKDPAPVNGETGKTAAPSNDQGVSQ
jgi:hypothetical protein